MRRVEYDGKKVHIKYDISENGETVRSIDLKSKEKPLPVFERALKKLAGHAGIMMEMPTSYAVGLQARGVTFTWTKDILGATITVHKKLDSSHSPQVFHTVHKPSEPYNEKETGPAARLALLSTACVEALEDVIKEAENYIEGDRAQGDLFAAGKAKEQVDDGNPKRKASPKRSGPAKKKPKRAGFVR